MWEVVFPEPPLQTGKIYEIDNQTKIFDLERIEQPVGLASDHPPIAFMAWICTRTCLQKKSDMGLVPLFRPSRYFFFDPITHLCLFLDHNICFQFSLNKI